MLGFVSRSTRELPGHLSFKILYCSLVRSILEFSSCSWNPAYQIYSGRIERIQHRALKILGRKSRSCDLSYPVLEKSFNLLPLSTRREMYDMVTFFNILHSKIQTSDLLQAINIHVPLRATRFSQPFTPPFVRTNYLQNSPLIRLQRLANNLSGDIDFFCTSINQIRHYYLQKLDT
ncbi:hypothetical protein WDU94_001877 [Cyamophila willieti]